MSVPKSLCSQRPVDFFWQGCQSGDHLDQALQACLDAITTRAPGQNGWYITLAPGQEQHAKSKIKARLKQAKAGKLRYPTAVRTLRERPGVYVYELRWDHLTGTKRGVTAGELLELKEPVRLRAYYVEQPADGDWALGLHAHRKVLFQKEDGSGEVDKKVTESLQDDQIDVALGILRAGASAYCHVPELRQVMGSTPLAHNVEV